MSTAILTEEFKVEIPREIRDSMKLTPGQEFRIIALNGHIHIFPLRTIEQMQGFLKGMNTDFEREADRI